MKTFETEKHNIPEGATHYLDETYDNFFYWGMRHDGGFKLMAANGKDWLNVNSETFNLNCKSIPQTKGSVLDEFASGIHNEFGEWFKNHPDVNNGPGFKGRCVLVKEDSDFELVEVNAREAVYWFDNLPEALYTSADGDEQYEGLQHYINNLEGFGRSSLFVKLEKNIPQTNIETPEDKAGEWVCVEGFNYNQVDFSSTLERLDGDTCIDSDLYFAWSNKNIVHISEVSAKELLMNRHKLCKRLETEAERVERERLEAVEEMFTYWSDDKGDFVVGDDDDRWIKELLFSLHDAGYKRGEL